jgi:tetratricopeptide (TPR) repeat protein
LKNLVRDLLNPQAIFRTVETDLKKDEQPMRNIASLSLIVATLLLTGCDKESLNIDQKEERDPLVRTGQSYMDIKDWDKAEETFKQAIEAEPRMARPHLQLATIYQQHKINYIHAIYHYDRYLELRPDSEKAKFINDQKLKVAKALANTLINNSPEVQQVVEQFKNLQRENADLRKKLVATKKQSVTSTVASTTKPSKVQATPKASKAQVAPKASQSQPTPKTAPKSQTGSHQIYHVAAGDNLTKIAQKFYGTGDWEPIYEANKDRMNSPGDLRVGQTLVIPNMQP